MGLIGAEMVDEAQLGQGRTRKSLLAFGRALSDAPTPRASAEPRPDPSDSPQERHRQARARREARPNVLLGALADGTEPTAAGEQTAAERGAPARDDVAVEVPAREGGIAGQWRNWLGRSRKDVTDPDTPRRNVHAASAADEPIVVRPAPTGSEATARSQQPDETEQLLWTPLIDPLKVIGAVFDSKRLILATTILGTLIGVGIALSTVKKYEAITELLADPRDLKLSDRNLTEQGLPSDATLAIVENQVRILTSGSVLNKVVEKLNLTADPEFNGERKSFGIGAFIAELRGLLSRSGEAGDVVALRHTLAIENLARSLQVERGGKTFVITIGAKTESAEKSALIANTMADVFLETYGQIQSRTAGRAADELTARLDELRKGVEEAERKVAAFKAENDIVDPQGRLITDDEIVKLNDQLSVARARTLELNARAASVRDVDVDSVVGDAIPESINSSIITELRSQYAASKQATDRIAVRLGPRHPERQAAEAQLSGAREQIRSELRRIVSSVQIELKRAVELEQQLAQRLAQLKVRQGDLSTELVQLRELEREVTTKRAVYESYLLRARETGEQRDINTANMTVISPAYPPLDPTGPSRAAITLTGMLLGFASGVGLAAMRGAYEGLRDRRRSVQPRRPNPPPGRDRSRPPPTAPRSEDNLNSGASRLFAEQSNGETARDRPAAPLTATQSAEAATTAAANEDLPMHQRYADPHLAFAPGYPGQSSEPAGWAVAPAGYAQPPQAAPQYQPASAYGQPMHGAPAVHPGYQHPGHFVAPSMPPAYAYPAHAYQAPMPPHAMHAQPGYASQPAYGMPVARPADFPYHPAPGMAPPPMAQQPYVAPDVRNVVAYPDRRTTMPDTLAEERVASSRAIEEIRASLAEFREAVRDLTEARQKRRFF